MDKDLEKEIRITYADCQEDGRTFDQTKNIRRLRWKADKPVSGDDVKEALRAACAGYNDFDPTNVADAILTIDPEAKVWVAREGSVCLYIETEQKIEMMKLLEADEVDLQADGSIRFWWD